MPVINRVPELVAERFGGAEQVNIMQVQREIGLPYATVSRWVRGKVDRADFPILEKWCEYLGVGVGDILEYHK
jgi:DNA-binding Xre family transcriptional regulator